MNEDSTNLLNVNINNKKFSCKKSRRKATAKYNK